MWHCRVPKERCPASLPRSAERSPHPEHHPRCSDQISGAKGVAERNPPNRQPGRGVYRWDPISSRAGRVVERREVLAGGLGQEQGSETPLWRAEREESILSRPEAALCSQGLRVRSREAALGRISPAQGFPLVASGSRLGAEPVPEQGWGSPGCGGLSPRSPGRWGGRGWVGCLVGQFAGCRVCCSAGMPGWARRSPASPPAPLLPRSGQCAGYPCTPSPRAGSL